MSPLTLNNISVGLNLTGLFFDIYGAYQLFKIRTVWFPKARPIDKNIIFGAVEKITTHRSAATPIELSNQAIDHVNRVLERMSGNIHSIGKQNDEVHQNSQKWFVCLSIGFILQLIATFLQFQIPG